MKKSTILILSIFYFCLGQTNKQIKQAKKMAKSMGMSESDVRALAKDKGFSDSQIENAVKINQESENIDNNEANKSNDKINIDNEEQAINSSNTSFESLNENDLNEVEQNTLAFEQKSDMPKQSVSYFGYDIFKKDPSIFQPTDVGAVDPEYLIGPNDEIIVMLWGETQFRQVLKVDREGFIFIPEIGQVFVNGLNLNLLESKLFRVLSQFYASLNPQGRKATTFLDISIGRIRPLRIQVLGEVAQPGSYTVSPSATVFSALYYFNGPTFKGSLRDIQLIRGGKQIISIDFYDYLLTGKKLRDQKLQLDDVIFIPKRQKTVTVQGQINNPGIYELGPKETLKDLISFAKELKITAYMDRAQIDRIVPFNERENYGMDRMIIDVNLEEVLELQESFPLHDGDKITIFSIMDFRQNIVNLSGAVSRPGAYELGDSLRLSELIIKADSLLGDAYLERVDIIRTNSDFSKKLIKLDLRRVLEKDMNNDILLESLDQIIIYSESEMIPKKYVSVAGHVKKPGRYQLQDNMSLYDLIFISGGFLDKKWKKLTYLKRAELVRASIDSNSKKIIPFDLSLVIDQKGLANELLQPDDSVIIYSSAQIEGRTKYVKISGHVRTPGNYELYENNMRVYDLLFKAGGFDDPLFLANTFLERADLIRYDEDRITQSIIPFNLGKVLNKDQKYNFKLNPGDHIRVYSQTVFNSVKSVIIDGVIRNPGSYSLKTGMSIKDLILEAGGVSEDVYKYKIEISRVDPNSVTEDVFSEVLELEMLNDYSISKANSEPKDNSEIVLYNQEDFKLKPYDFVVIRPDPFFRMQRKVKIIGSVYYPGEYALKSPYDKLSDIVNRAGGLRHNAYPFGSTFTRNGETLQIDIKRILKKPKSKLNILLQEGDVIEIAKSPGTYKVSGEVNIPGMYQSKPRLKIKDVILEAGGYTMDAEHQNVYISYPNGTSKKYRRFLGNHKVFEGSEIVVGKKKEEEPFDSTEYLKELTSIIANLAQAISILLIVR